MKATKKSKLLGEFINDLLPPEQKKKFDAHHLEVYCSNTSSNIYDDILKVRAQTHNKSINEVRYEEDQYSDLYCTYRNGTPIACIRAIRDTQGKFDCQDFYPKILLQQYAGHISQWGRFCSLGRTMGTSRIGLLLFRAMIVDQFRKNVNLGIFHVRDELINYYLRYGFLLVSKSDFIHPITKGHRQIMVLPFDKNRSSSFQDLFQLFHHGLDVNELKKYVQLQDQIKN